MQQCTPDQIEEKRRQALERRAARLSNHTKSPQFKLMAQPNQLDSFKLSPHKSKPYERPKFQFHSKVAPKSVATVSAVSSEQFYGNEKVVTAKCVMINENRFVVEMTYMSEAIDIFKTMPSRNYNTQTKIWSFHIQDYDPLLEKLKSLQPKLNVEPLPKWVLSLFKNNRNKAKLNDGDIDFSKIDPELYTALMPFQLEGVCFGIEKEGRCLIADDMGLGKTFQALAIASYYQTDWPLLIVTTASMRNTWETTIHKYLPSVSIMETQYMVSGKDYIGDARILIVSHDLMSRALDKLLARRFGVLVVDESHVLKNFKAKCTKSAIDLAKVARRVILLSGTPALSRPSELFTQLNILDARFFGSFFDYSRRYCDGKSTQFGWDASGKSNLTELEVVLSRKFMIRRTKADVLKSLPNKVQEIVKLDVNLSEFSAQDRKCLQALADRYNSEKKGGSKHAALLTFFAETAHIKIPSVCSYILQVLEGGVKFLVFAHHQKMLDAIEKIVRKKDVKFIRIDGNTTTDQRNYFVNKFQTDDKFKCAILSITAANAGITLTAAQLVLFAELHWNPSIISQAESRAHRIGQAGAVHVRYLIAPGTADDSIWPLLQEKQKILNEVGLCKDSFDTVSITKQNSCDNITNGLDLTLNLNNTTVANTLDISLYFKSADNQQGASNQQENAVLPTVKSEGAFSSTTDDIEGVFDDGMDDILSNIDL